MSRLARLAAAHGVAASYEPAPGRMAFVPDETLVEVLAAFGVDAGTTQAVREALRQHEQDALRLLPPTVVPRAEARTVDAGDPARAAPPPALRALPEGTALRVITEGGQARDWGPGAALPPGVHTLHAQAPDGRAAHAVLIAAPE